MLRTSIYIHYPFCLRKCLYCDFNSTAAQPLPPHDYVALVLKEMELRRRSLPEEVGAPTLYLGGGTPSLMTPELVGRLVEGAARLFPLEKDAEVTIEGNPGTLSVEKLKGFRAAGVNRLSLGIQSFDDHFLAALGRVHSGREAIDAYFGAREAGFTNVSIDLMHSLSGQSPPQWLDTLRRAVLLAPEHISAYALTVEEDTPFGAMEERGELPLPGEEEGAEMFDGTIRTLGAAGYRHYEISNFALPGCHSRHNGVYWSRGSYLGFGAGAHSFLNRDGLGRRWSAPPEIGRYAGELGRGSLPEEEVHTLTAREAISETFFLGLRRLEGIDLDTLPHRFPQTELAPFLAEAEKLVAAGALLQEGRRVRLAPSKIAVANSVFCRFL